MSFVTVSRARDIVTVSLARPEARNALSGAMLAELTKAFEDTARDSSVRVVVLAGEGRDFCAGGDLGDMQRLGAASLDDNRADARRLAPQVQDVPLRDLLLITVATDAVAVEEIRRRAAAGGYAVLELEARLALVRLGHGDARAVARDAAARGLGRIAALAGRR